MKYKSTCGALAASCKRSRYRLLRDLFATKDGKVEVLPQFSEIEYGGMMRFWLCI